MNDLQDVTAMRELLLNAPIPWNTRLLALLTALTLLAVVLWLVRRRDLREEYTPIWLLAVSGILLVSVWQQPVLALSRAVGAWSHASTLFFTGQIFLIAICLNYAVKLSRVTLQLKNLGQEVALLRAEIARRAERDRPPS